MSDPNDHALETLAQRAIEAARAAGATHADAVVEDSRSLNVKVHEGRIDTLRRSATHGLGLRVIVDDAVGVVSTNDFDPEALAALARHAVALARLATPDPANVMPTIDEAEAGILDPGDAAGRLGTYDPAILAEPAERVIERALALERIARGADARITRCDHAGVTLGDGAWVLANTHGVLRRERGTSISSGVVALADDGMRQQSGGYGVSSRSLAALPAAEAVAREAVARAVARIGARGVPSARVPVVMHPDIAASWIGRVAGAFSGEQVMKRASWLSESLGQTIAAPLVTLVDDARLTGGLGTSLFDGEGVRTGTHRLIDRGVCARFVYDLYTARRVGGRSTGNASRSYTGAPGIGFHNLYVMAGETPPEKILASVERGFYMDDQGSFGFNPVTGDYSFQAQGFWIERGEKAFPVDGVTVASRSLDMLRGVTAVGTDLVFDGSTVSPTLLIAEMMLSGR